MLTHFHDKCDRVCDLADTLSSLIIIGRQSYFFLIKICLAQITLTFQHVARPIFTFEILKMPPLDDTPPFDAL